MDIRKYIIQFAASTLSLLSLAACSGLSKEAKEIADIYYLPELSDDTPVLELHKNGMATIRTIYPEVAVLEVSGKWNVINDTLVIDTDISTLSLKGDSTLHTEVTPQYRRRIARHDEHTLTLLDQGIEYRYIRRSSK